MSPRVTVLLAVHNGEPYVHDAVASILGQTFADFELLVVDDASTDTTVATIESFGDERIRILRNERNLGQVPSLNRGLREARGELIARIDHDDSCRPERLERQVAVLDAEPQVALVGSWMDLVDASGTKVGRLESTIADFAEFLFHTLIMRVYVAHPAALYRRDPVLALGGYDETTGPAEDKDLWRKLALERWDARIVPEPLVVYRLHDAQLSQTKAAYQQEVDGASQERFLAALAPGTPVHALRLLLANDRRFWATGAPPLAELETLLIRAAERLRLAPHEEARVRELVALRLLEVGRTHPWKAAARALFAAGLATLRAEQRGAERRRIRASYVVAPGRPARPGEALADREAALRQAGGRRMMEVEAIRQEHAALVERHGAWTAHNIRLADGVYTLSEEPAGDEVKLRRVVQIVSDLCGADLAGTRVLDLACLEGMYAIELARRGAEVVAIEGREANLEKARFAARALGVEVDFQQGDVRDLSRERHGEFDVVLCLGILYHLDVEDVFPFVDRMAEVCRRALVVDTAIALAAKEERAHAGEVYKGQTLFEHDPSSTREERLKALWSSLDNTSAFALTAPSLERLLARAGFTSVLQCWVPAEPAKTPDRITLVALKGTEQRAFVTPSPAAAPTAVPEQPPLGAWLPRSRVWGIARRLAPRSLRRRARRALGAETRHH
jgi:2-polyprenyl-3-methyl-5-hydroxy-6-metoxy-1,4-benzoquinol methylase